MPDIVVWLESSLAIALWVNRRWPPFVKTKIKQNCQQNGSRFVILVTTMYDLDIYASVTGKHNFRQSIY